MYGRNGMDALNNALFWLYILLWAINLFARNTVLASLCTVVAIYMLFRFFSRNLPARRSENLWYWNKKSKFESKTQNIAFFRGFRAWWKKTKTRVTNVLFREKRYRTCPGCRAELCLPRRRGKHTVKCPKCGNNFNVNIII